MRRTSGRCLRSASGFTVDAWSTCGGGPLYLDIAAKGLCLAGVGLMIFGQGGWFTVGIFAVFLGVLIGAWAMLAARRTRPPGGHSGTALFGGRPRRDGPSEEGGNS